MRSSLLDLRARRRELRKAGMALAGAHSPSSNKGLSAIVIDYSKDGSVPQGGDYATDVHLARGGPRPIAKTGQLVNTPTRPSPNTMRTFLKPAAMHSCE